MVNRLGFIGAGAVSRALIEGVLNNGLITRDRIIVTNKSNDNRLAAIKSTYGVCVTRDPAELSGFAETIVVAPKPAAVQEALSPLQFTPEHLVVSVAAGVPIAYVQQAVGARIPVIRAMPNICCQVGSSLTAIALGNHARPRHETVARSLFGSVGSVINVSESHMNTVTAVSGSGPAYFALLCELLALSAESLGLHADTARQLTIGTLIGTAKLLETGIEPAAIRRSVSSPNGTTMAALDLLEQRGFDETFIAAIRRAAARAGELSGTLPRPRRAQAGI